MEEVIMNQNWNAERYSSDFPFSAVDKNYKAVIIENAVKSHYVDLNQSGVWYADYVRLRMKAVKDLFTCQSVCEEEI